jgi:hypothetical protein
VEKARKWRKNWIVSPFQLLNEPFCFWYQPSDGTIEISKLTPHNEKVMWRRKKRWVEELSIMLSLYMTDGTPIMLMYNSSTGYSEMYGIYEGDSSGYGMHRGLNWKGTISKNWTHFTSFSINNGSYFLAYSNRSGEARFYRITKIGTKIRTSWQYKGDGWDQNWTHFNFFTSGNSLYLLMYKASDGWISFTRVLYSASSSSTEPSFSDSPFAPLSSTSKDIPGWSSFVTYKHLGKNYLFKYNKDSGKLEVWNLDNLNEWLLIGETIWSKGWDTIIPYSKKDLNGKDYLWFLTYDSGSGRAEFGRIYSV